MDMLSMHNMPTHDNKIYRPTSIHHQRSFYRGTMTPELWLPVGPYANMILQAPL